MALAGCAAPRAGVVSGRVDERPYRVITGSQPPAVGILFLHGAVEEAYAERGFREAYLPLFRRLSGELPVVVVYPDARPGNCRWDKNLRCWSFAAPGADVPFLKGVTEKVGKDAGVRRWIGVGFSNGGYFLASALLSGETLPLDAIVLHSSGMGWYKAPDIRWRPGVSILSGKTDAQTRDEARELHALLLKEKHGERAALTFEEFAGGHELAEKPLLAILLRLIEKR